MTTSIAPNHSSLSTHPTLSQPYSPITTTSASIPNATGTSKSSLESSNADLLLHFRFFNVYKDGRIVFFAPPSEKIPPVDDPDTGVKIRDVKISDNVSVRMFLPPVTNTTDKLPILLYVHGGAFCMQSAFSIEYTRLLTRLVHAGKVIAVSVEYGLFPECPIPACYEDSWEAIQWVASHAGGGGGDVIATTTTDPWLSSHADFNRVFIGGDSAGANICHLLAVRAGSVGLPGRVKIEGAFMVHPFFGENDKMWMYMCPTNEGPQDPRMRPPPEDLAKIQCGRVLVMIAEKDRLREGSKKYVDDLVKSGWKGTVEIVDHVGKGHCFHLMNPDDDDALAIQTKIISFIHHNKE